jgi:magnesium transporter
MSQGSYPPTQASTRTELRQLVQAQLETLLQQENYPGAKALLDPVQPADIASVIGELPEAMQALVFRLLSKDQAIEVYEYLDLNIQQALIAEFKKQEFRDIIDQMSPDDRARLFDELPAKVVTRLLDELSTEERKATAMLLGYKPDTAGRIMTPEYISLKEHLTVTQALERIRSYANAVETIYQLYVIDDNRHLTGTLSLRELVVNAPDSYIGDIVNRNLISVYTNTPQEEVARIIQHYDFIAVPVVDTENRLVGIVTVDDVFDVLQEETTEDIYRLGGLELGEDDYFQSNIFQVARKRVVWLLVLLVTNTGTSAVIKGQEELLEQVVALAAFIPLLIDAGGNVGAQSSTVVIRGLNTEEVQLKKALKIIRKEALAGIVLGAILGVIVVGWAYVLQRNFGVALSVGISLFFISVLAAICGAGLPFLFKAMKFDPALMSAPFITTVVDVLGVLIYLNLARFILGL